MDFLHGLSKRTPEKACQNTLRKYNLTRSMGRMFTRMNRYLYSFVLMKEYTQQQRGREVEESQSMSLGHG